MAKEDNKKKPGVQHEKGEEVLQGIVLGDSFDRRFSPITLERPRTLLPLVNIPLLDYTLELLASGGIQHIFVLCCVHSDQIKKYIETSRWSKTPGVKVEAVVDKNSKSTGDALRNIYSHNVIQSDFVLISGDVVSNMNISNALKVHKERREKDKSIIMTMVFKQASPSHRTRSKQDDIVVGFNSKTCQLLHYENCSPKNKRIGLSSELFSKNPSIQLRYDLIDCHIDICSPEVLAQFSDNFDFGDIRKDFIHQVMESDIYDFKMTTYVLQGEYAARVKDLRTYHSVSKDIIHRWTFPMVPDNNFMCNTTYTLSRQMIYKERSVKLRDCTIGEETVLGKGTEVGDKTEISHSIIGRNVKIGNNVRIYGAYLWDGVVIEDGATVEQSIICERAIIKSHATISKGSIVSFGVIVGDNVFIEPFTKITVCRPNMEDVVEDPTESMDIGANGVGRRWTLPNGAFNELVPRLDSSGKLIPTNDEPTEGDDTDPSGDEVEPPTESDYARFYREAAATVRHGLLQNHTSENIIIEVNSLKYAFNRDFIDSATAVMSAVLEVPASSRTSIKDHVASLKTRIARLAPVLQRFLAEDDIQIDFIFKIQDICDGDSIIKNVFQYVLHALHDNDVLSEDAILAWAEELEVDEDEDGKSYLTACSQFLTWLRDAEEDSEEEEDESGESDSD